jgi:hypothetical protein
MPYGSHAAVAHLLGVAAIRCALLAIHVTSEQVFVGMALRCSLLKGSHIMQVHRHAFRAGVWVKGPQGVGACRVQDGSGAGGAAVLHAADAGVWAAASGE